MRLTDDTGELIAVVSEMRHAAPSRGRIGSAASSRTRPRFPGALNTSPVSEASYTILRRPPTIHDGVYSTQPTEAERSSHAEPKHCASGDGESPSPTANHPADRRGAAFRTRGGRLRGARGALLRRGHSVAEQCAQKPVEQNYQEEDWEKECALPVASAAEDGGDHKTTKKKEQKRVHWEEDDRLTTVYTVPSRSSCSMRVGPENHRKEEDWNEACASPTDSTGEIESDEATVLTDEEETQEEEEESPLESDCPALEQGEDSSVATSYEEEDWEPECRPPTECSPVAQQDQSTAPLEGQDEEQRQCAEEAPAAKQCDRETMVSEEAWMRECAPLMDCSSYTKRKAETVVPKEQHGEQRLTQDSLSRSSLAAATQTDEDTSGSDDECYWDDDDDDLSGDEPTVIIRLDPRPEEEERTTWQNLGQRQAPPVATASTSSTQMNFTPTMPTEANAYFRQGARQGVQEAVSAVDQYGQEYNSEAASSGSSVQLVPVVSYLCFPVVMYQPCTVETTSPTDLPVESSQPYDTATQELPKENHWEVACTPATYYSPTSTSCNSVTTSEERWRKERSCAEQQLSQWTTEFTTNFNVTSPQLYNQSPLSEDVEKGQDWDAKCQPLPEFTLTTQAYNGATVFPEARCHDWQEEFPSQHSEATQTRFGAVTSEWHAAKAWEREHAPAAASEPSAEVTGYYGTAATEVPESEEEDWDKGHARASSSGDGTVAELESEEDWEQEIVPGKAGYVPQVPTIFQRMRHRSQRQRRRLYREQAANFRQQEEERSKANADDGPMEVGGHRASDGSGPSGEDFVLPVPPVPVGACQEGPQGSQLNAAAVNRTGRRTMADVVRSSPAPAQPPVASSSPQPPAPVVASYQAAAGDQVQVTPEEGTWETASFLQSAWTVAAGTDGCVFYESDRHTR